MLSPSTLHRVTGSVERGRTHTLVLSASLSSRAPTRSRIGDIRRRLNDRFRGYSAVLCTLALLIFAVFLTGIAVKMLCS
jgi:hypothetical protein